MQHFVAVHCEHIFVWAKPGRVGLARAGSGLNFSARAHL